MNTAAKLLIKQNLSMDDALKEWIEKKNMNERIIRLKKENGSLKTGTAEMEMDSKCLKVATMLH